MQGVASNTVVLSSNTSWYLYNFRASTIQALLNAGYKVVCLSPADDYSQKLADLGCEWIPLPMDNAGTHPVKDLGLLWRFYRCYRKLKPLVVFHFTIKNNVYGTWAARALGIPAVNNVSGLGTAFIRSGVVAGVVRALYRLSQPFAYKVFCQNPEDLDLLKSRRLVPARRLALLPGSGVDLNRFNPGLLLARPNGSPLRVLYAGRMLADKGLHELIEAVQYINSKGVVCTLDLCGFAGVGNVSSIGDSLLQQWAQLPGVRWLGPSDNMPAVYANADAVVLPSYREGMPRSLLEAAAMGLPVVATNVPGCRHIVKHGENGLLCEARSAGALRHALEQMLEMTEVRRCAMGLAGRKRVEADFSEQRVVDAALNVVQSIEKTAQISL
ncbi:glycosyltransferase family 4 protein [uncultured Limnobacter sp.]|uniref:glycosyltransferase family 4 protein n=1 Tax=uncultured Limnobacter sp. TaxID=199681 RepID=UPI0030F83281